MPNPKRRHSRARTSKRRTHHKAQVGAEYVDRATGIAHRAHHICPETGTYRGRQVVTIKTKSKGAKS